MKTNTILALTLVALMASCSKSKLEEKGFRVSSSSNSSNSEESSGLNKDSLKFETQPSTVLMTGVANVRITTIYKVNKNNERTFIGSNNYLYKDEDEQENNSGNNWNDHLMPGFEGVYGYNLVNVSHYSITENKQKLFFEKPVLIKTVYFPSFLKRHLKPQTRLEGLFYCFGLQRRLQQRWIYQFQGSPKNLPIQHKWGETKSADPGKLLRFQIGIRLRKRPDVCIRPIRRK